MARLVTLLTFLLAAFFASLSFADAKGQRFDCEQRAEFAKMIERDFERGFKPNFASRRDTETAYWVILCKKDFRDLPLRDCVMLQCFGSPL